MYKYFAMKIKWLSKIFRFLLIVVAIIPSRENVRHHFQIPLQTYLNIAKKKKLSGSPSSSADFKLVS